MPIFDSPQLRGEMRIYVYVLRSTKINKNYVGMTQNLAKRIREHNLNRSHWTMGKGPWILVYVEIAKNRYEARAREKFLKSGVGRKQVKKIISGRVGSPAKGG